MNLNRLLPDYNPPYFRLFWRKRLFFLFSLLVVSYLSLSLSLLSFFLSFQLCSPYLALSLTFPIFFFSPLPPFGSFLLFTQPVSLPVFFLSLISKIHSITLDASIQASASTPSPLYIHFTCKMLRISFCFIENNYELKWKEWRTREINIKFCQIKPNKHAK